MNILSKNNLDSLAPLFSLVEKDWELYKNFVFLRLNKAKDLEEEKKEEIRDKVKVFDEVFKKFSKESTDFQRSLRDKTDGDIDFQVFHKSLDAFRKALEASHVLVNDLIPLSLFTKIVDRIKETLFVIYNMFIAGPVVTEGCVITEAYIPRKETKPNYYFNLLQAVGFLSDRLPQDLLEERFNNSSNCNISVKNR